MMNPRTVKSRLSKAGSATADTTGCSRRMIYFIALSMPISVLFGERVPNIEFRALDVIGKSHSQDIFGSI